MINLVQYRNIYENLNKDLKNLKKTKTLALRESRLCVLADDDGTSFGFFCQFQFLSFHRTFLISRIAQFVKCLSEHRILC